MTYLQYIDHLKKLESLKLLDEMTSGILKAHNDLTDANKEIKRLKELFNGLRGCGYTSISSGKIDKAIDEANKKGSIAKKALKEKNNEQNRQIQ